MPKPRTSWAEAVEECRFCIQSIEGVTMINSIALPLVSSLRMLYTSPETGMRFEENARCTPSPGLRNRGLGRSRMRFSRPQN